MRNEIEAVAFDIDGTLYPNRSLYARLVPFAARHHALFAAFGAARREIREWQAAHPGEAHADFYAWQASIVASHIGADAESTRLELERLVYDGWRSVFARVRTYPHVADAFRSLKSAGLRLGLLSDFRPDQKGDVWGLAGLCDAVIGSELVGALKPSPIPFEALADALKAHPSRVLYVGNSLSHDVEGAHRAGMRAALVAGPLARARAPRRGPCAPEFSFSDYRQLVRIVLK